VWCRCWRCPDRRDTPGGCGMTARMIHGDARHLPLEDDASMPDRITPHPDYWTVWAPSPWPEKNGEPHRVGVYHTRRDAEKAAAQWPNLTCWIIEPAKEN